MPRLPISSSSDDFMPRPIPARSLASLAAGIAVIFGGSFLLPQTSAAQTLTKPVYRVANTPAAVAPTTAPAATAPQAPASAAAQANFQQPLPQTTGTPEGPRFDAAVVPVVATDSERKRPAGLENSPFDIYEIPGEHPLMPCLRIAKQGLQEIDSGIKDYSATMTKKERINGTEGETQQMAIRVRHQPFSVHMKFIQPFAGREVLYNSARNNGKLVALDSGWKRRFGKVKLDPNGMLAMKGQRYPITMTGIRNLITELIKIAEQDIKYGECTVRYSSTAKIDGRPVTMIEATHPVPRKNFRFNIARIFLDHELRVPVAYIAYSWPQTPGGKPILEEQYIYTNVKLNNNFTDVDFDETNPNLFN